MASFAGIVQGVVVQMTSLTSFNFPSELIRSVACLEIYWVNLFGIWLTLNPT